MALSKKVERGSVRRGLPFCGGGIEWSEVDIDSHGNAVPPEAAQSYEATSEKMAGGGSLGF